MLYILFRSFFVNCAAISFWQWAADLSDRCEEHRVIPSSSESPRSHGRVTEPRTAASGEGPFSPPTAIKCHPPIYLSVPHYEAHHSFQNGRSMQNAAFSHFINSQQGWHCTSRAPLQRQGAHSPASPVSRRRLRARSNQCAAPSRAHNRRELHGAARPPQPLARRRGRMEAGWRATAATGTGACAWSLRWRVRAVAPRGGDRGAGARCSAPPAGSQHLAPGGTAGAGRGGAAWVVAEGAAPRCRPGLLPRAGGRCDWRPRDGRSPGGSRHGAARCVWGAPLRGGCRAGPAPGSSSWSFPKVVCAREAACCALCSFSASCYSKRPPAAPFASLRAGLGAGLAGPAGDSAGTDVGEG